MTTPFHESKLQHLLQVCHLRLIPGRLNDYYDSPIYGFIDHYHGQRNHQGLKNRLIEKAPEPANTNGRIFRQQRLGGSLS